MIREGRRRPLRIGLSGERRTRSSGFGQLLGGTGADREVAIRGRLGQNNRGPRSSGSRCRVEETGIRWGPTRFLGPNIYGNRGLAGNWRLLSQPVDGLVFVNNAGPWWNGWHSWPG